MRNKVEEKKTADDVVAAISSAFSDALAEAFRERFGTELETVFDVFGDQHNLPRANEEPLAAVTMAFLKDWEAGYKTALRIAREAAGHVV
ncbi:MAG TPA: hypothetical protein EYP14_13090 [Planctomycetaceae bacterium]|nr:hypothetical protein [Planctomycetaceae bacterium]